MRNLTLCLIFMSCAAALPAQVFFEERFDNNAAGWTLSGDWQIGAALAGGGGGSCGGVPDPAADASGALAGGIAGTIIGGNQTNLNGSVGRLTSPVIDTSCQSNLILEIARQLNSDYMPFMRQSIEAFNAGAWHTVWENGGAPVIADPTWIIQRYDISAFAGPGLRIRFGYEVLMGGAFSSCTGWNLDNVRIYNPGHFFETFDDNSAGWTLDANWQIGPATPYSAPAGGCANGDPAFDGSRFLAGGIAGIVIGGPIPSGVVASPYYLTSPAMDINSLSAATLSFDRFLNSDYANFMINTVEVFDGSSWQTVFMTGGAPITADADWSTFSYDVTAYRNASFAVRFGTIVSAGGAYSNCGSWNVDNVLVFDPSHPPMPALGQAPLPGAAVMDVNSAGACYPEGPKVLTNHPGPYFSSVSVSAAPMVLSFAGAPNQAIVLLSGVLNTGANPIGMFGQLDIGTPGLGGLSLVAAGTEPGFINSLFRTNPGGIQSISAIVPAGLAGSTVTFQAIFFHPTLLIQASNAVSVAITP